MKRCKAESKFGEEAVRCELEEGHRRDHEARVQTRYLWGEEERSVTVTHQIPDEALVWRKIVREKDD